MVVGLLLIPNRARSPGSCVLGSGRSDAVTKVPFVSADKLLNVMCTETYDLPGEEFIDSSIN